MNQPAAVPAPVTHVSVTVEAYQAVLNILQELPYKTAAPVLQALQSGTTPIQPGETADVDGEGDGGAE
jgi:hypothetical protein